MKTLPYRHLYLSVYLGRFPQLGGSRQHKRNNISMHNFCALSWISPSFNESSECAAEPKGSKIEDVEGVALSAKTAGLETTLF